MWAGLPTRGHLFNVNKFSELKFRFIYNQTIINGLKLGLL